LGRVWQRILTCWGSSPPPCLTNPEGGWDTNPPFRVVARQGQGPGGAASRRDAGKTLNLFLVLVYALRDRYTINGGGDMDILIEQYSISENPERNAEGLLPVWEETKKRVLEDLTTNFLHNSETGRGALTVAKTLSDSWWKKRESEEYYQLIQELYRYAEERAARETRQAVTVAGTTVAPEPAHRRTDTDTPRRAASRFSGGPRRPVSAHAPEPVPERSVPPIAVSVPVERPTLAVLELTRDYLVHPEKRPSCPFRPPVLKDKKKLSARSHDDYARLEKQVLRELGEKKLSTGWDLAFYLVRTVQEKSLSTYKKRRAVILRLLETKSPGAVALIRALPQYGEMCKILGLAPYRRSTVVTEARRAKQNPDPQKYGGV
jgi:hypothetical protein